MEGFICMSFLALILLMLLVASIAIGRHAKTGADNKVKLLVANLAAKEEDLIACVNEHKEMCNLVSELKKKLEFKDSELSKIFSDRMDIFNRHVKEKDDLIKQIDALKAAQATAEKSVNEAAELVKVTNATIIKERRDFAKAKEEIESLRKTHEDDTKRFLNMAGLQECQKIVDNHFIDLVDHATPEAKQKVFDDLWDELGDPSDKQDKDFEGENEDYE